MTGLVKDITDWVGAVQVNSALRERIELWRDKAQALEDKVVELEKENAALKEAAAKMQNQLTKPLTSSDYVYHKGAAFKRLPSGGANSEFVYCPKCYQTMGSPHGIGVFQCSFCKHHAGFSGHELSAIQRELAKMIA